MPRYNRRLTDSEIITLIESGELSVDLNTGDVYSVNGTALSQGTRGRNDRPTVCIRRYNARRWIAVHQLVWIAGTRSPIPPGFEVHHLEGLSNAFRNLICLHSIDHAKIDEQRRQFVKCQSDELEAHDGLSQPERESALGFNSPADESEWCLPDD